MRTENRERRAVSHELRSGAEAFERFNVQTFQPHRCPVSGPRSAWAASLDQACNLRGHLTHRRVCSLAGAFPVDTAERFGSLSLRFGRPARRVGAIPNGADAVMTSATMQVVGAG
jgi:hypothetical protein